MLLPVLGYIAFLLSILRFGYTNLDLETIEALIEAIRSFQGGVLLVSHHQNLLTSVCEHLYVVENGRVEQLTKCLDRQNNHGVDPQTQNEHER